ncbi:protein BASIC PENTACYSTEINE6-like [Telopea speciosissima]|uniref:protein BASIC PENTACYSTEINE6-like n=1 Tax=Telopea speciosissima TaxID=54955 RepID=UPI001CC6221E|nr:protein BASIC PENTACYSTEINE6-like [Telopea speciosissima]XP_043709729.1 protein BASIC PENTACYSTEINE6-like [Telopea speciosissima]XP_043709730.1 protein BASIC PENTACYSTEINE6-like [Telopea speciosissima]
MDDGGQRENGRHKPDHYKAVHSQWMNPQHQMKEHNALTVKQIMAIMAERDAAIHEKNLAISEKKAAVAEREMAILQKDAAIAERNSAIMERDNALAALQYRENAMNASGAPTCTLGYSGPRGTKHMHHHHDNELHLAGSPYGREIHTTEAIPISAAAAFDVVKPLHAKRARTETKTMPLKTSSKSSSKGCKKGQDLNKVTIAKTHEWRNGCDTGGGDDEDQNRQIAFSKPDWKGHDLGLNQVTFDESTMPVPVCSCTGVLKQCYKWGNGGWQSACCTTNLSMYPLPAIPNKRHARKGGRKMSGSAFAKLLTRLAAEGHDLSTSLDLKDHWAKHGTNRFITIK